MSSSKVKAKVHGENVSLLNSLKSKDINARLIKGAVLIELPESNGSYQIPEEIAPNDQLQLLIEAVEWGGGMSRTGECEIVCGLSGKKLRPYFVPKSGPLANNGHAYFAVPEAVVTIFIYSHYDTTATITENRIIRKGNIARIQQTNLWDGRMEKDLWDFPKTFARFIPALQAGIDKVRAYHCRSAYYAEGC